MRLALLWTLIAVDSAMYNRPPLLKIASRVSVGALAGGHYCCCCCCRRLLATKSHLRSHQSGDGGAADDITAVSRINSQLITKVYHTLETSCNFAINSSTAAKKYCLLSVSGGVDSLAMLHVISSIKKVYDKDDLLDIEVVHFNHKLREPISTEEQLYVKHVAEDVYKYKFYGKEWSRSDYSNSSSSSSSSGGSDDGKSIQLAARKWRLSEVSKILRNVTRPGGEEYADAVSCAGHHSDDDIETSIFNLFRGAHISKLKGIAYRNDFNTIRPLLNIHKSELYTYMHSNNFKYFEDESNFEDSSTYTRNRIRNELIPLIEDIFQPSSSSDAGGSVDKIQGKYSLKKRLLQIKSQSRDIDEMMSKRIALFLKDEVAYNKQHNYYDIDTSYGGPFDTLGRYEKLDIINKILRTLSGSSGPFVSYNQHSAILYNIDKNLARKSSDRSIPVKEFDVNKCAKYLLFNNDIVRFLGTTSSVLPQLFCRIITTVLTLQGKTEIRINHPHDFKVTLFDNCNSSSSDPPSSTLSTAKKLSQFGAPIRLLLEDDKNEFTIRYFNSGDRFDATGLNTKLVSFLRDRNVPVHLRSEIMVVEFGGRVIAVPPVHSRPYKQALDLACDEQGSGTYADICVDLVDGKAGAGLLGEDYIQEEEEEEEEE